MLIHKRGISSNITAEALFHVGVDVLGVHSSEIFVAEFQQQCGSGATLLVQFRDVLKLLLLVHSHQFLSNSSDSSWECQLSHSQRHSLCFLCRKQKWEQGRKGKAGSSWIWFLQRPESTPQIWYLRWIVRIVPWWSGSIFLFSSWTFTKCNFCSLLIPSMRTKGSLRTEMSASTCLYLPGSKLHLRYPVETYSDATLLQIFEKLPWNYLWRFSLNF